MTREANLAAVKLALDEQENCRTLTDEQLGAILTEAADDFRQAVYLGALRKAANTQITLPDGTTLPDSRDYWLRVAAVYRPNRGGAIARADDRRD